MSDISMKLRQRSLWSRNFLKAETKKKQICETWAAPPQDGWFPLFYATSYGLLVMDVYSLMTYYGLDGVCFFFLVRF